MPRSRGTGRTAPDPGETLDRLGQQPPSVGPGRELLFRPDRVHQPVRLRAPTAVDRVAGGTLAAEPNYPVIRGRQTR